MLRESPTENVMFEQKPKACENAIQDGMWKSTPGRGTSKCHGSEASVRKTEEAGVAGAQKGGEECRRTERGRWAGMEGPRGHCKNFGL